MPTLSPWAETIFKRTYSLDQQETWEDTALRVAKWVANGDHDLCERFFAAIRDRKFIPGGRYLATAGTDIPMNTNCFLLRLDDTRESWAEILRLHMLALSLGGGVGTEYTAVRAKGTPIKRFKGVASGPVSVMKMVNEIARYVMSGGKRRSALWAGLNWQHPDIEEFIAAKNWPTVVRAMKEQDFNSPAPLDMTNISAGLDDAFFKNIDDPSVRKLYYNIVRSMCKTGEPGFSVNIGKHRREVLRNPCTEVVSDTHADTCNLGSLVLPRIADLNELEELTRLAVEFLYLGTMVGHLPAPEFEAVREQNRRIGLGFMGLHEWLLRHDLKYEPNGQLGRWLSVWQGVSDEAAEKVAVKYGKARPVAVRAVAPTGTIGVIGETTTGIEPVFCVAYKRRFLSDDQKWKYMYVIDPTVERLVQEGFDPAKIEDAHTLATDVERRLSMQAFVQDFVDQSISSTVNLPEWGEEGNNNAKQFGNLLLKYLPRLRGITVYPEGSRPGQPITPVKYDTAKKHADVVYEESAERCAGGVCGI